MGAKSGEIGGGDGGKGLGDLVGAGLCANRVDNQAKLTFWLLRHGVGPARIVIPRGLEEIFPKARLRDICLTAIVARDPTGAHSGPEVISSKP